MPWWWKDGLPILAFIVLVLVAALVLGRLRWIKATRKLPLQLEVQCRPQRSKTFQLRELRGLPGPVQRYLRQVLKVGQPMIVAAAFEHSGTLNLSPTAKRWKRFTSTQWVSVQRPGFVWNARMRMAPGLAAHMQDGYVAGAALLHAALLGIFTLFEKRDTGELARGALMRYLAEAAWYPTALLPSQGVRWEAIDAHTARASLRDGSNTVELLFGFDAEGLIATVTAEARSRQQPGSRTTVNMPWTGRFWNHAWRDGMRVPLNAEVAWIDSGVPQPYYRASVERLAYRFAGQPQAARPGRA